MKGSALVLMTLFLAACSDPLEEAVSRSNAIRVCHSDIFIGYDSVSGRYVFLQNGVTGWIAKNVSVDDFCSERKS